MISLADGVKKQRVLGIDVARGVALLGIFFVNAITFGMPIGVSFQPEPPVHEGLFSTGVSWFTAVFCAGKFYPLFSILFGAGLAVMFDSAQRRQSSFEWLMLRRLTLLAIFGILHIVLLWYGDILLIYALIGFLMIWVVRFSSKSLLIVAGSFFLFGLLLMVPLFTLIGYFGSNIQQTVIEKPMPVADTTIQQYFKVFADWNETEAFDSRLIELETQIMSQGPFLYAAIIRIVNYLIISVSLIFVLFWIVFPCFCVGAALMKAGFFHGNQPAWRSRLLWLGGTIGLPICVVSAWASTQTDSMGWFILGSLGTTIGGPMVSLFYLSAILVWAESSKGKRWLQWLSNAGRMALSCYLLESLLMSAVMAHWGLARFGSTTWGERFLWVIAIFATIVIFANLWMSRFRQGPIEWLWRRFTYWGETRLSSLDSPETVAEEPPTEPGHSVSSNLDDAVRTGL